MKGVMFCIFAAVMLTAAEGGEEGEEGEERPAEPPEPALECFRCDLGFWDACYTTHTLCSPGEKCFTGRGKAADVLDVKTLGCTKAEECEAATTTKLFPNTTVYTVTKTCCDTNFCNAARALPFNALLIITGTTIPMLLLTAPSVGLQ